MAKTYLVDVPVAIHAFIRPQLLSMQWNVIKQARPSVLFIRSDGPRPGNSSDNDLITKSRAITEDIDWDCKVYRLYEETNIGMYSMLNKSHAFIWDKVDRCVFLEDDMVPSVSFFQFCADLLEKYKDDSRIDRITGVNLCGVWEYTPDDYFFARVPASSGIATWRRSYECQDNDLSFANNPYAMKYIKKSLPWYLRKQFISFAKHGVYANHPPACEFYTRHAEYLQNKLVIVPKYNQISNNGVVAGSTHTASNMSAMPKSLHDLYGMPTTEMTFPLKHPLCVFPDREFEKKREEQLGVSTRLQHTIRTIERTLRLICTGNIKRIITGLRKRLGNRIEK